MANIQKTEAIVIKTQRFRETSRIITLFSEKFGKIKVIAKGIRSPKSRFGSSLELFTNCNIIFYKREGKDLYIISESNVIHPFTKLKNNLESFTYAIPVLEFLNLAKPKESRNPDLYKLTLETLELVEKTASKNKFQIFLLTYLLKGLRYIGYEPEFKKCIKCKCETDNLAFSIGGGGILCASCGVGETFCLSRGSLTILRKLKRLGLNRVRNLLVSKEQGREITELLKRFFIYHTGKEMKTIPEI